MKRREFLAASAALASFAPAVASGTESEWYNRPMRWAQIAFVEDDPGNYDPQFWLDYFKRLHIDAATISAGGDVAFYPTKIPLHYRSKWLDSQGPTNSIDTFGDLHKQLKSRGLIVVA